MSRKQVLSIQSHVIYGHAGNSAAVFPLQRNGIETWPMHTVQFSNHTQYSEKWTGEAFSVDMLKSLFEGLMRENKLQNVGAVVTGYQGSSEQCTVCRDIVQTLKKANEDLLYVCDPVMGSDKTGCVVSDGIKEAMVKELLPIGDIIVPNQFEFELFSGEKMTDIDTIKKACQKVHRTGVKTIVVKYVHSLGDDKFYMFLSDGQDFYLSQRPLLAFDKPLVGIGDLITSLFTARILQGESALNAFIHTNNAVADVVAKTKELGVWELPLISEQESLVKPRSDYSVQKV